MAATSFMWLFLLTAYWISHSLLRGTPSVHGCTCRDHHQIYDKVTGMKSLGTKCVELQHEQERVTSALSSSSSAATVLTWVYNIPTNTVSVAYTDTALSPAGWVGWGVNLHGTTMLNANVLIGFQQPAPRLLLYKLTSALYSAAPHLAPVASFADDGLRVFPNMTIVIRNNSTGGGGGGVSFTILATLLLPPGVSSINTIYNRGPSVMAPDIPTPHGAGQRNGMKTIHLATGLVSSPSGGGGVPGTGIFLLKCVHGALAIAAWGFLLLLGAMAARYMKRVEGLEHSAWFSAHVWVQMMGYLLGTIAWALGVRLGALSPGVVYYSHRNLGIAMVVLATLQVTTALVARPRKLLPDRQRRRLMWEILHRANGYTVLLLAIVNIFKGFAILAPPGKYRAIYIAFVVLVSCTCVAIEARAWLRLCQVLRQRWGHKPPRPFPASDMNSSPTA